MSNREHYLILPFPAQGHMIPLLDLACMLEARGVSITILVTPKNLFLLSDLPSSIQVLVLPFPHHPSVPVGVENMKDAPPGIIKSFMQALGGLYDPIVQWFRSHPLPPCVVVSDMFLGWTHHLACHLGIPRVVFSPSGAFALSTMYALWKDMPKMERGSQNDFLLFERIPNSPKYPWSQISPLFRGFVEGDPASELVKDGFRANMASWGLVVNSFMDLERVYVDYLKKELGHNRVWAVGPLLPVYDDKSDPTHRGGPSAVSASKVLSWLDTCQDQKVVYVSFGSQAVLTNPQMEALALGLEQSGAKFVWAVNEPTQGDEEGQGEYGKIPPEFEGRVGGRGLVIKGWAPQVSILNHRAVSAFLTHCGWNSTLEGLAAGVQMLAWPMGADQFVNATLLVDELKVGITVCEGSQTVPDPTKIARAVADSVKEDREERVRALQLRTAALEAVKEGGSSFKDFNEFMREVQEKDL
ncbi:UDP-glucuronosyl/UDP-glucosyltransferase [Dillenia turbinata]|uniref:Glycosyltransferase n=1 Tax=Dillenia turbinata TaxID=194707 RepID=A0AAN8V254_9MAGN